MGHHIPVTAYAAGSRETAGNNFSENRQIRVNAVVALGSSRTDAETGNHFVTDQQCAVPVRQPFTAFHELLRHRPGAALRTDRFDEDRRRAAGVLIPLQMLFQILQIVREELVRVAEYKTRYSLRHHALRSRNPDPICHLVRPPVVRTAHLQNIFLSGSQPCNPGRTHTGLRTGSQHPEHLHARHHFGNLLRQLIFIFVEQSGGRPAGIQQINDLLPDHRVIASQNRRAAGLEQIIILVPVQVIHLRPLRLRNDDRERIVESQIVLHTSRDHRLCLGDHGLRLPALLIEIMLFVVLQRIFPNRIHRLPNQLVQLLRHRFRIEILIDAVTVVCHILPSCYLLVFHIVSGRSH